MAFTYGFYNSVNHDRLYDAVQISSIFDGVINDGVFESIGDKFAVTAYSGMTIHVGTGKAWFNHTWTVNDSIMNLTVSAAESILTRIDSVVLEVDASVDVRANTIKILKGAPASTPVAPSLVNTATKRQIALANITVSPGATSITTGDITNLVGLDACPFVTGIIQTTSVEELYSQWEVAFNTWFQEIKDILDSDTAGHLQNEINEIRGSAIAIDSWNASTQTLKLKSMT